MLTGHDDKMMREHTITPSGNPFRNHLLNPFKLIYELSVLYGEMIFDCDE